MSQPGRDGEHQPSGDTSGARQRHDARTAWLGDLTAAIALFTAMLGVLGLLVYGVGVLAIAFKLAFRSLSFAVLAQLPRGFVFAAAAAVILQALAFGTLIELLRVCDHRFGPRWRLLRVVRSSKPLWAGMFCVLWAVVRVWLISLKSDTARSALWPTWKLLSVCAAIDALAIACLILLLPSINRLSSNSDLRRALVAVGVSMAAIPAVASVAAIRLMPPVTLCGPDFSSQRLTGNLLGSDGSFVYVASFQHEPPPDGPVTGRWVTIVPLSSVRLEVIGPQAECSDVAPAATSTP